MYFGRGSGGLPSIERISALDSPDTKMPTSKCSSTVEVEAGAEDVIAQQSVFFRLSERRLDMLDELRRIMTGIDESRCEPIA